MLQPYTVLDFTDERGEIGPMLLGDLGADVIRVELPGGNRARYCAPFVSGAPNDQHSLQFIAFNRNKRSIVLDPTEPADVETLQALVKRADFLFESSPESTLAAFGLDFKSIKQHNARIVLVKISPFGSDGPHANLIANDLVLAAMGGPVSLQGSPDRAPIRISVPQAWRHTGVEAAAGALVAHANMLRTGSAQFVDLSAQCVMTWTMLNAMDAFAIQGQDFIRGGSAMNNGVIKVELVHPTADGYIVALPMSAVILGCMDWMIEDGVADPKLRRLDWAAYDQNLTDPDSKPFNLAQGTALLRDFLCKHTKQELFEFGLRAGISLAPVNTLPELLGLQHMQLREYWQDQQLASGVKVKSPGLWAKPSNNAMSIRRNAPTLDQHGAEIRAELAQPAPANTHDQSLDPGLPFDGVKVTDFAWVGVGPISSKYLADHGARVVRVESESRPDVLRAGGPYVGDAPGINQSQFFGDFNTSKKSLSLDMKSPQAIDIAKRLISESDVLIESFAPGAIDRMGLGYEQIKQLNPGIIMVSTCLMGQTGPASGLAGYGYHAAAIAGFYEVTGYPDEGPTGPWVAYTDTIAPRFVSVLLAAALDHKRRTGEGCFIDVAQIETALHFLAPELLHLQSSGEQATRLENRSAHAAPQGIYQCKGDDEWCAIGIDTDSQWQALCKTLAQHNWLDDVDLATTSGRMASHDLLDATIAAWTAQHSVTEAMAILQAAGVPAGKVQRSSDLLKDPQYAHRQFYRYYDHAAMGHIPYAGHQYRIADYDNGPRGPAPLLGEHSFEVLSDILGMDDESIAAAYAEGIIA